MTASMRSSLKKRCATTTVNTDSSADMYAVSAHYRVPGIVLIPPIHPFQQERITMAKKHKSPRHNATNSAYDRHDHRADELVFDLVIATRDITFDVASRDKAAITLHAHTNNVDTDPIVVIVTSDDYIVNGTHYENATQTLDALAALPSL